MRKTISQKTKIGLTLIGIIFALFFAIGTLSTIIFASANELSVNYLDKITIYVEDGQSTFRDNNSLRAAIDALDSRAEKTPTDDFGMETINDAKIEVVVGFDFDYRKTAEYGAFSNERDALVTQSDVDNFRQRLADKSSAYHRDMTASRLNGISFSAAVEDIAYSPFIKLSAECAEFLYSDVVSFAQSRSVKSVDIFSQVSVVEPIFQDENTTGTARTITRAEMLTELGGTDIVDNARYTGSGVRVGISEVNWVAQNLFNNITYRDTPGTTSDHARDVSAVVRTIAPSAPLYFSNIQGAGTESPDFEWYIDELVSVINCSWGLNSATQTYQSRDIYADYQVETHFINVVKSAGNRSGANGTLITSPGYGRNLITVTGTETGSNTVIGNWKRHSEGASFATPAGYNISKPTLAAPFRINVPSPNSLTVNVNRDLAGTSFAAPQVTAAVALLFEKYPYLSVFPERVLAMLEASADHTILNDYNDHFSEDLGNRSIRSGSGVLNIENLLNGVSSERYVVTNNNRQGQTIAERSISLTAGQAFKANAYWIGEFAHTNGGNHITNYDLRLLNSSGTIVAQSNSTTTYSETITCAVPTMGTYRLIIHQTGAFNGNDDIIGLAYSVLPSTSQFDYDILTGSTVAIKARTGATITGAIEIPRTVVISGTTYNVTQIAANGFSGKGMTSVIFESPSNVTTIGASAFANCTSLSTCTIPSTVTSIGTNAFYNTGIYNNTGNNSIVYAGNWVVGYKGTISGYITLNAGTVGIADYALANCPSSAKFTIPNSLKYIGTGGLSGSNISNKVHVTDSYDDTYSLAANSNINEWFSFGTTGTITVFAGGYSNQQLTVYNANGNAIASTDTTGNIMFDIVAGEMYRFNLMNNSNYSRTMDIEINASPAIYNITQYSFHNTVDVDFTNGDTEQHFYFEAYEHTLIQFLGTSGTCMTIGYYINYGDDVYGYWESNIWGGGDSCGYVVFNPYHGSMTGLIKVTVSGGSYGDEAKIVVWTTTNNIEFVYDWEVEDTEFWGYHRPTIYVIQCYANGSLYASFSNEDNINFYGMFYVCSTSTGEVYYSSDSVPYYDGYAEGYCNIVFYAFEGSWTGVVY